MPEIRAAPHIPGPGVQSVERTEVPIPLIDYNELLVRVQAVGVGIHDSYFLPTNEKYPFPIGIEAAGIVERVSSAVRGYKPGDHIVFSALCNPKVEFGQPLLPST